MIPLTAACCYFVYQWWRQRKTLARSVFAAGFIASPVLSFCLFMMSMLSFGDMSHDGWAFFFIMEYSSFYVAFVVSVVGLAMVVREEHQKDEEHTEQES
jgi:Na+/melibiose symporter-like transporter